MLVHIGREANGEMYLLCEFPGVLLGQRTTALDTVWIWIVNGLIPDVDRKETGMVEHARWHRCV